MHRTRREPTARPSPVVRPQPASSDTGGSLVTWGRVVALGGLGSVTYAVLAAQPDAAPAAAVTYALVNVVASVATAVGARRRPGGWANPWWWVLAMQVLWSAASVHEAVVTATGHLDGVTGGLQAVYLLGYLPPLVALALMLRRSRPSRPPGALADATVLGVGLAVVCWATMIGPVQQLPGADPAARLAAGLFLTADNAGLVLVVVLLVSSSRASTSTWLVLAAVLAGIAADSTVLVGHLLPSVVTAVLAAGWTANSMLWAAAALHPGVTEALDGEAGAGWSPARFAAMLVGMLLAPAAWALSLLAAASSAAAWPAVLASSVMSVLVVCRLGLALRTAAAALAERERIREALHHQARHDSLTGLPNRAAVLEVLAGALADEGTGAATSTRGGGAVGLLFIDLDGFKAVNDAHGHRAGDEVLRVVAARLRGCVRPGGTVGRWGGDEFVIVMDDLDDGRLGVLRDATGEMTEEVRSALLSVAQRVVSDVPAPVDVGGHLVSVGASVGAASATGVGPTSVEALLHEADTAAYRAKAAGRGRVELSGGRVPAPV